MGMWRLLLGKYMKSLDWERRRCLMCIDWHWYIEKEKESGGQPDPFASPPTSPSQTAVDGARSSSDTLQILQIRNQNTELFERQKILHQMIEQQQQMLDKQQKRLEQQRQTLEAQQMVEQMPVGQIETMQKQDDTTGVGEILLKLHEKVDSLMEFCKSIPSDEGFKLVEC